MAPYLTQRPVLYIYPAVATPFPSSTNIHGSLQQVHRASSPGGAVAITSVLARLQSPMPSVEWSAVWLCVLAPLVALMALLGQVGRRCRLGDGSVSLLSAMGTRVSLNAEESEVSDLHLVSLLRPPGDTAKCAAARCWGWKDRVLGDGHDFFVPRRRTARRLAVALMAPTARDLCIAECVVLGNCTRLEVYVATVQPSSSEAVKRHVVQHLAAQMEATTKRSSSPPLLRWPDDEQSIFYLTVPDKWTPEMEAFAGSFSTATGAEAVIEPCIHLTALLPRGMVDRSSNSGLPGLQDWEDIHCQSLWV
eukprot:EG_transcript_15979